MSRHVRLALASAGGFLAFSIVVYALLLHISFSFNVPRASPDVASIQLGFAQAFTSFLSLALAIFLGTFAYQEFTEHQLTADVRLVFKGGSSELTIDAITDDDDPVEFSLELVNLGRATALWYIVEFDASMYDQWIIQARKRLGNFDQSAAKVWYEGKYGPLGPFRRLVNSDTKWAGTYKSDVGTLTLNFRSDATTAVFPGYPVEICYARLPLECMEKDRSEYQIRYHIAGERMRPVDGCLRLNLRWPDHDQNDSAPAVQ